MQQELVLNKVKETDARWHEYAADTKNLFIFLK